MTRDPSKPAAEIKDTLTTRELEGSQENSQLLQINGTPLAKRRTMGHETKASICATCSDGRERSVEGFCRVIDRRISCHGRAIRIGFIGGVESISQRRLACGFSRGGS